MKDWEEEGEIGLMIADVGLLILRNGIAQGKKKRWRRR
jgi:hypothetical protein